MKMVTEEQKKEEDEEEQEEEGTRQSARERYPGGARDRRNAREH